jgi:putative endonuclease
MHGGWVYIVTNKPHGALYVGVTADLVTRIAQRRERTGSKHARRYNLERLVYAEPHATIEEAIAREKAVKAWQRVWKLRLIQEHNPEWRDLFETLNG